MPRLPFRRSWQQLVESKAEIFVAIFLSAPLGDVFPFGPLREITDSWLRKEKLAVAHPVTDERLVGTILTADWRISARVGREIGLLSCVHVLSDVASRQLLSAVKPENSDSGDLAVYLRCLVFASLANPGAVLAPQRHLAKLLLQLTVTPSAPRGPNSTISNAGDNVHLMQGVIESLARGGCTELLPLPMVHDVLEQSGGSERFRDRMAQLWSKRRLASAYQVTSSIRHHTELAGPQNIAVVWVLTQHVPEWRTWAAWRPNERRIAAWESGNFLAGQRERLFCIFDLDGPDKTGQQRPTLRDSDPTSIRRLRISEDAADKVDVLLEALRRAVGLGSASVELAIRLCIVPGLQTEGLVVLRACLSLRDDDCSRAVVALLDVAAAATSFYDQLTILTRAIPMVSKNTTLQDYFARRIAPVIDSALALALAELDRLLEDGLAENLCSRMVDLGKVVMDAEWLHQGLSPSLCTALRSYPPRKRIQQIFTQLRATSTNQAWASQLKTYIKVALGVRGASAAPAGLLVDEMLVFMERRPDASRAEVAIYISQVPNLDPATHSRCLGQVMKEHDVIVQDLQSVFRGSPRHVCIRLASILAGRHEIQGGVDDCWTGLLVVVLATHHAAVFNAAGGGAAFTIDAWLTWLKDLRRLIPAGHPQFRQAPLLTFAATYTWWIEISDSYLLGLQALEGTIGRESIAWMLLQGSSATALRIVLGAAQNRNAAGGGGGGWFQRTVISLLSPTGTNLPDICDCLVSYEATTDIAGRQTCETLLRRSQYVRGHRDGPAATATLAYVLAGASGVGTDPARATFQALIRVLGVQPAFQHQGLGLLREASRRGHEELLAEAARFEVLRLCLLRHDRVATTALLTRLGVDQPAGRADADVVPEELADVIEHIEGAQYELSFPLTHLRRLERQARGLGASARMLVLRLSLDGSNPGFCMHVSSGAAGEDDQSAARHPLLPVRHGPRQEYVCGASPSRMAFQCSQKVLEHFRNAIGRGDGSVPALEAIYSDVAALVDQPGAHCLYCCRRTPARLWRAQTCSPACASLAGVAPLTVLLPDVALDPTVMDLLLTCLHATAVDQAAHAAALLPGCPVPVADLAAVVDSFPPPSTWTTTAAGIAGGAHDAHSGARGLLLRWMASTFAGFLACVSRDDEDDDTAAEGGAGAHALRVPSMPRATQFLLLSSARQREQAFVAEEADRDGDSDNDDGDGDGGGGGGARPGVVFHGTRPSRLFPILADGLISPVAGDPLMLNGQVLGEGIYAADNPSTAMSYSGSTGHSWAHSGLRDRRVLLGCELLGHAAANIHVVPRAEQARILVRYIFLCPTDFHVPVRRHVEPGMKTAYAFLRSARSS